METEGSDQVKNLIDIGSRAAAQSAAENFPVALRVIPARPRGELHRLYQFARFVDDVGDEADGDRLALLDLVDRDVRALDSADGSAPSLPAVAAMQPVLEQHGAPTQPLLDLVAANRVDQTTTSYATFDDLLGYCRLSAAPVGQMVLYIADAATEENIADSDLVCAALQILEHCQDVGEDARKGRIYLPQNDLRACGVAPEDLHASTTSRSIGLAVELQVTRARRMLRAGRPLVHRLQGWAKVAVSGYVAGGLATAAALQRRHYDVLSHQIRPSRWGTAARALTAAGWR